MTAIKSLPGLLGVGAGVATAAVLGIARLRDRMEVRPSQGPSKASTLGGSCLVTSPEA